MFTFIVQPINSPSMKYNILVCDDDNNILDLCELILTTNGFNVSTISDCGDLYIKMHSFKPDIILMDLWMTKVGGEEAVKIIKQNNDTEDIPILIFSALFGLDKICQKLGTDGFIEKPFDVEDFIKKINKTLLLKEEKAKKILIQNKKSWF